MKILFVVAVLLLSGCSTLGSIPGTAQNTQQVNVLMSVAQAISTYAAAGCIPPVAATDPAVACAPVTATDQTSLNNAINACLAATATQMVLANVHIPKCQTVPGPAPVVVATPVTTPPPPAPAPAPAPAKP